MTETRKKVYLTFSTKVHRLARIGAAAQGTNLSEFVSCLILEDATRRGVEQFLREAGAEREDEQEGNSR